MARVLYQADVARPAEMYRPYLKNGRMTTPR